MALVESVNVFGVDLILFLQSRLPTWGHFFMMVSRIGDPSLAFTFYFPLAAVFSLQLGTSLLWTLIVCEWSNMILKWVMAGDRPYWWVHESSFYLHKSLPHVRQFPLTCETGPGMPSGHSTLNAAMFFLLTTAVVSSIRQHVRPLIGEKMSSWMIRLLWVAYGLWIGLVMMSRIFIAAHFPHQCLAGVVIGVIIALWISSSKVFHVMTKRKSLLLTAAIFLSVGVVFAAYRALGNNPMWSLNKAVKWCINREYIHIDTTPFYSLSRYSGQTLGLGLALASSFYTQAIQSRFTWKMKLSLAILTLATGQASVFIHRLLPSSMMGYYVCEFLQNMCLAYLIMALLPYFVMISSGVKPKSKPKGVKSK